MILFSFSSFYPRGPHTRASFSTAVLVAQFWKSFMLVSAPASGPLTLLGRFLLLAQWLVCNQDEQTGWMGDRVNDSKQVHFLNNDKEVGGNQKLQNVSCNRKYYDYYYYYTSSCHRISPLFVHFAARD